METGSVNLETTSVRLYKHSIFSPKDVYEFGNEEVVKSESRNDSQATSRTDLCSEFREEECDTREGCSTREDYNARDEGHRESDFMHANMNEEFDSLEIEKEMTKVVINRQKEETQSLILQILKLEQGIKNLKKPVQSFSFGRVSEEKENGKMATMESLICKIKKQQTVEMNSQFHLNEIMKDHFKSNYHNDLKKRKYSRKSVDQIMKEIMKKREMSGLCDAQQIKDEDSYLLTIDSVKATEESDLTETSIEVEGREDSSNQAPKQKYNLDTCEVDSYTKIAENLKKEENSKNNHEVELVFARNDTNKRKSVEACNARKLHLESMPTNFLSEVNKAHKIDYNFIHEDTTTVTKQVVKMLKAIDNEKIEETNKIAENKNLITVKRAVNASPSNIITSHATGISEGKMSTMIEKDASKNEDKLILTRRGSEDPLEVQCSNLLCFLF